MEQFIVSARKYRPATFNTVVGQSSITTTLKNAIRSNQLAQAFLFTGPRGVGKTTCARILAKTINCANITSDTEGCNACESCISFNSGQSMNIFELDAASNSTVDDMRGLIEQVRYHPQSGKYRTYIIDEVHMLSAQAFNAFLKTLEEPPAYAKFILATTEKHKIIPTILSRCQIFDFNRITTDDIATHLSWVAESENVLAEPEALHLISQKADGALRDALSIFDQIVSYAGNSITVKHVSDNLNVLDHEYYFRITDLVKSGNHSECLIILDEIVKDGFHLHHFISGLSSHIRDLLICKDSQTIELLETTPAIREKYKNQAASVNASLLFNYLDILSKCDYQFGNVQHQRLHTELAILKMSSFSESSPFTEVRPVAKAEKTQAGSVSLTNLSVSPSVLQNPSTAPVTVLGGTGERSNLSEELLPKSYSSQLPVQKSNSNERSGVPLSESQPPPKRASRTGTISITQKLSHNHTEAKVDEFVIDLNPEAGAPPMNPESAKKSVMILSEKFKKSGRHQLASALTMNPFSILENNVVEFVVNNAIQSDEIKGAKNEIIAWLREQVPERCSDISCRIAENSQAGNTAYTPLEKFEKMAEKNPHLQTLKRQFDLDIEF